jgi:transglutaminase-like putative cysteine protease
MFADIYKKYIQPKAEQQPVSFYHLGFGGDVSYNTLLDMKKIINDSIKNYDVIETARKIVQYVNPKDYLGEAEAIYDFVRDHSRYVRDPVGLEHIQTPLVAIAKWHKNDIFFGDCDDYSVLLLSLLKSIGFPVKLIAASYKPSKELAHVYGATNVKGLGWLTVEGIKSGVPLGWEAPGVTRKVELYV